MDLKDLKIFEAKLLSIKFKRFICRHRYNVIATHKMSRANLWKCEKCGDLLYQNYNDNVTVPHYNKMINKEDWRPWPSSRDLKEELDE